MRGSRGAHSERLRFVNNNPQAVAAAVPGQQLDYGRLQPLQPAEERRQGSLGHDEHRKASGKVGVILPDTTSSTRYTSTTSRC